MLASTSVQPRCLAVSCRGDETDREVHATHELGGNGACGRASRSAASVCLEAAAQTLLCPRALCSLQAAPARGAALAPFCVAPVQCQGQRRVAVQAAAGEASSRRGQDGCKERRWCTALVRLGRNCR